LMIIFPYQNLFFFPGIQNFQKDPCHKAMETEEETTSKSACGDGFGGIPSCIPRHHPISPMTNKVSLNRYVETDRSTSRHLGLFVFCCGFL
jgi:hypothetical protein